MERQVRHFANPLGADRAMLPLLEAWRAAGWSLAAPEVREPLVRAVALTATGEDLALAAQTQFALARHLRNSRPTDAIWLYKRGANALQSQRAGLPTNDYDRSRAWLALVEDDLRDFIGLLIDNGRLVEAEQAIALLRGEELAEFIRRGRGPSPSQTVQLSFTSDESIRNERMSALSSDLRRVAKASATRIEAELGRFSRADWKDPEADAAWNLASAKVAALLRADSAMHGVSAKDRADSANAAQLPVGVARVAYFVREHGLEIVVHTSTGRHRVTVPSSKLVVNRQVQDLRAALSSPGGDPRPAAQMLWRTLIAPVERALAEERVDRLVISPDGALRYVPFAALYDGQRYLVQRWVSQVAMGGNVDIAEAQPLHGVPPSIVAFGRSVSDAAHAGLPGVAEEMETLRSAGAKTALDAQFTRRTLAEELHANPTVVHIASHFKLDPSGEDRSYLLTGDGQRLSLSELRQLPWHGVQLALLSSCESAVALEGPAGNGRELVGFASALQSAGVPKVMATLWRVDDKATAAWMRRFYQAKALKAAGTAVKLPLDAGVLAAVQRDWLTEFAGRYQAHPHYWAAFEWLQAGVQ